LGKLQKNHGGDRKSTSQAANLISPFRTAVEEAGIGKDDAWRYQQVGALEILPIREKEAKERQKLAMVAVNTPETPSACTAGRSIPARWWRQCGHQGRHQCRIGSGGCRARADDIQ